MNKFKHDISVISVAVMAFMAALNVPYKYSIANNFDDTAVIEYTVPDLLVEEKDEIEQISNDIDFIIENRYEFDKLEGNMILTREDEIEAKRVKYGTVIAPLLNVRSTPEINNINIVDSFENGTQFIIEEENDEWLKTENGWIYKKYTQSLNEEDVKIKIGKKIYRPFDELMVELDGIPSNNINISYLDKPSGLTIQQLDYMISLLESKGFKNSQFVGRGKDMLIAERKYGVNALFMLSIGLHESYFGTSYSARNNNNLFGLMYGGKHMVFNSPSSCIDYAFANMKNTYFSYGLNNVNSISYVYCNPPEHWASSVNKLMMEYKDVAISYADSNNIQIASNK